VVLLIQIFIEILNFNYEILYGVYGETGFNMRFMFLCNLLKKFYFSKNHKTLYSLWLMFLCYPNTGSESEVSKVKGNFEFSHRVILNILPTEM
jgi:hypothetical protein